MEQWIKSSYSRGNGGDCLEMRWTTSSYSNNSGGDCVECRTDQDRVLVRDTQNRALGHFAFPGVEWTAFLHAVCVDDLGQ